MRKLIEESKKYAKFKLMCIIMINFLHFPLGDFFPVFK